MARHQRLRDLVKLVGQPVVPQRPKLVSATNIITPNAGFTVDYGEFWLSGPELVIRYLSLGRAASTEVVKQVQIEGGSFDAPFQGFHTEDWLSDAGGFAYLETGTGVFVSGEWILGEPGDILFRPHEDLVATANQNFRFLDMRFLLADPAAAYEAYQAL